MHFDYLGDHFAIVDAPGSIGFAADAARAVAVADIAIVVVDPDPARAALAAPALRMLDELGIPHLIFVNRIDQAHGRSATCCGAAADERVAADRPPDPDPRRASKVTGFVDLALERAYHYVPGKPSEPIAIPAELAEREAEARTQMLEQLADHDDALLEQLLMDEAPEPGADLRRSGARNRRQSGRVGAVRIGRPTAGACGGC